MQPPPLPDHSRADRPERYLAGFLALTGMLIFVVASVLNPYSTDGSPRTRGTHRQLGLPPCWTEAVLGFPCPSCGMTTSISLLAHGDPFAAISANWAGVVVGGAGLGTIPLLGWIALSGRRPIWLSTGRIVEVLVWTGMTTALARFALMAVDALIDAVHR